MIDIQEMLGKIQPYVVGWAANGGLNVATAAINYPPTDEQVRTAFGVVGAGFRGILQDTGQTRAYLCACDGSTWWTQELPKAYPASGYTYGSELLSNPGFETAGGGGVDAFTVWNENPGTGTITQDGTRYHGGSYSAKMTGVGAGAYMYQGPITVVPGQIYLWSFWILGDGTNEGKYAIYDLTHSSYFGETQIPLKYHTAAWTQKIVTLIIPPGCTSIRLLLFAPTTGTVYVDDCSLKTWQAPAYLYDNFARADGDPWVTPGGFGYILQSSNNAGYPVISGGMLDSPFSGGAYPASSYSFFDLPNPPTRLYARFKWKNNGWDIGSSTTLCCFLGKFVFASFASMIHFYVTTTGWVLTYYDSGGVSHSLGSGSYATPLLSGVEYSIRMDISVNTATLYPPDGSGPIAITDSNIGLNHGPYCYFQMYRGTVDQRTSEFTYIEARY